MKGIYTRDVRLQMILGVASVGLVITGAASILIPLQRAHWDSIQTAESVWYVIVLCPLVALVVDLGRGRFSDTRGLLLAAVWLTGLSAIGAIVLGWLAGLYDWAGCHGCVGPHTVIVGSWAGTGLFTLAAVLILIIRSSLPRIARPDGDEGRGVSSLLPVAIGGGVVLLLIFALRVMGSFPPPNVRHVAFAFDHPYAVAVDIHDNVYVADTHNHQVEKFSAAGRLVALWTFGQGRVPFSPESLAVDRRGNLYVGDIPGDLDPEQSDKNRVIKISPSGRLLAPWHHGGSGRLGDPDGLAVDGKDNVYVADYQNGFTSRVAEYAPSGRRLRTWLQEGMGITVDALDNFYVTEFGDEHIYKLSPRGKVVAQWGSFGDGEGQFRYQPHHPIGLAADGSRYIYVADLNNDRVQKFTSSGRFLDVWYGFSEPTGLAVDKDGNVYIADANNNRIQERSPDGKLLAEWG